MGTEEYIKYKIYLGIGWERWYGNCRVYKVYNIPRYRLGEMVWELKSIKKCKIYLGIGWERWYGN